MTEKEKMIAGEPYRANAPELIQLRRDVRLRLAAYNFSTLYETDVIASQLLNILGKAGKGSFIEPPFYCDYGFNITVGNDFYMNFDCVMLDVAPITIGNNV